MDSDLSLLSQFEKVSGKQLSGGAWFYYVRHVVFVVPYACVED